MPRGAAGDPVSGPGVAGSAGDASSPRGAAGDPVSGPGVAGSAGVASSPSTRRQLTRRLEKSFRGWVDGVAAAPIAARVLGAIGVLAVLVAVAFTLVLLAMANLRGSTNEQVQANRVTASALRLERVVDELEQSLRGFVLTRNRRILASWDRARDDLPAAIAELERRIAEQPAQAGRVRSIVQETRSYVADYGIPLTAIALESPAAALSEAATTEGLTRIGEIRRGLARILVEEDQLTSARASSARHEANRAVILGTLALGASGILLLLVMGYLVRSVARPVHDVASGAARIAAGDLSIRIPSGGPAEIRELTSAFNSMAESLEQGRRALERQNEQLRQSERAKSELISIVSHELRTPLASILGYTSLILRREADLETMRRYVEVIEDQGRRLAGLVEGFLEAEESEGRLELEPTRLDLSALLRKEAELIGRQATEHEVVVELPENGLVVRGDRDRLTQVVTNLLTNAIKYSPEGGKVVVRGERDGDLVRVLVQDEGLGISEEHQPRIFTKFFRGEARASGIPGVGLGLAVAREIVEAHGGRIAFKSAEDEGSTFWFELPAHRQESEAL
jgi:signal transduction histidine kinase